MPHVHLCGRGQPSEVCLGCVADHHHRGATVEWRGSEGVLQAMTEEETCSGWWHCECGVFRFTGGDCKLELFTAAQDGVIASVEEHVRYLPA